ncbi:DUF547 domain-containing protein [Leptolyngbya sp. BL0902]|uniref:DUF547 domain-containing protein n=1 Tax=Leptolyngbya sp. BL0902 TaxID=1115757 RepID=UPI0018E86C7B|nr:DUF547 domain-containing protein [Leptolyngbya sp. BL0902]QQE66026.1 DUF547 domain-containing protein [Leptolyngbya sp. BL0902]
MLTFAPWDFMLQAYVDDQGLVDYGRWRQESMAMLADWLAELQTVVVADLTPEEHLAFWLNLYNALMVQEVLRRYPITSIRPRILGFPNWLGLLAFLSRPVYRHNGQSLSLNHIEHRKLRATFADPRIHFALVCASLGCPILRNEAYLPGIVEAQLDTDAQRFLNHPEKVRYDADQNILYCSKIFQWYKEDFLAVAPSIAAYIAQYNPQVSLAAEVRYLPYDWGLNRRG